MKNFTINPLPKGKTVAFVDAQIHLPSPVKRIVLISSPSQDSHLYFHTMPLSKSDATSPIATTGQEPWIPMQGAERNFINIEFEEPTSIFYMSGDSGASGLNANFCLFAVDGIKDIEAIPTSASLANPLPVQIVGTVEVVTQGAANAPGTQVAVAATSTAVVAARTTRRGVMITMLATGADVYFAIGAAATVAAGDLLPGIKGASVWYPTNAAVNGISSTGTVNVSVVEFYD